MLENLLAVIQFAVKRSKLYLTRYFTLKRTGTFASESKVMCLFYLIKKWCFDVSHSRHYSVWQQLF